MRRRGLLLVASAALALAIPLSASAYDTWVADFYGKVTYSNGSTCAASACEFIISNHRSGATLRVVTGSLKTYFGCVYSYPNGNQYVCDGTGRPANAFVSAPRPLPSTWRDGDTISAYGRQACPSGGFHFSPTHDWIWDAGISWYGGTFQLSSACQT
jgi:hypothetical protein